MKRTWKCRMYEACGEKCTRYPLSSGLFYHSTLMLLISRLVLSSLHNALKCTKPWKTMKHLMHGCHTCVHKAKVRKKIVHIISSVILAIPMRCDVCFGPFYFNANSVGPTVMSFFSLAAYITAISIHNCGCATIASAWWGLFTRVFFSTNRKCHHSRSTITWADKHENKKERKINGLFIQRKINMN